MSKEILKYKCILIFSRSALFTNYCQLMESYFPWEIKNGLFCNFSVYKHSYLEGVAGKQVMSNVKRNVKWNRKLSRVPRNNNGGTG